MSSLPLTHRSYSAMNQLRTCGEQYRLQRIEKVPSRPSAAAVAGKIFHTASEAIDHKIVEDDKTILDSADQLRFCLLAIGNEAAQEAAVTEIESSSRHFPTTEWKRYGTATKAKPHGEDIVWFQEVAIPLMVSAYVDWRIATNDQLWLAEVPGFGVAIEVPFDYYVDGQLVKGYIDRIFTDKNGNYYPFDLKSGQKPKTDEQLGTYGAALKSALGWDIRYGFYIYGLKTGVAKVTPPLNISHWTDEKLSKVYLAATLQIDQGLYIPHPGDACFHCGLSSHCDYAQAVI